MRIFYALLAFVALDATACVDAPLPTSPSGPTWNVELTDEFDENKRAHGTFWRYQCDGGGALLLLTVEPISSEFFLCSSRFTVLQAGAQYDNIYLNPDPSTFDSFCGDLLLKQTYMIDQSSFETQWDPLEEFEIVFDGAAPNRFDVGGYDPGDYGQPTGPTELQGALSGSWFQPDRSGEGFVFAFEENASGPIATIYWFTHIDGRQYWLIGTRAYSEGDTAITFELQEVDGTGFGDNFDPDELDSEYWGEISVEFTSCTEGVAAWEADGDLGSGSYDLRRISPGLDRSDCDG